MSKVPVLYYAHDSGTGHLRHALNVSRHPDFHVTVLSGASSSRLNSELDYVELADDRVAGYVQPSDGPFHYVPTTSTSLRRRFSQIQGCLDTVQPRAVFVDVSAEVAAFVKLAGYPTIVRRMHGRRMDRAHQHMYDLADVLVAFYPQPFEESEFLERWGAKTVFVGMLKEELKVARESRPHSRRVIVLTSLGGEGVDLSALSRAAEQTPQWQWTVIGKGHGQLSAHNVDHLDVVADPSVFLQKADVVISSAGHNAVRAAVSGGRGLILFPEPRMYDEQLLFADALAAHSEAAVVTDWDQDWNVLLSEASAQNPMLLREALLVDKREFNRKISVAVGRIRR